MNKREKIVVSVTGLVAVIALLSTTPPFREGGARLAAVPQQAQALGQQVAMIRQQVEQLQSGQQELTALDWLKTDFPGMDPFLSEVPAITKERQRTVWPDDGTLVFQGSLSIGGRAIAWINDVEYAEGDVLLNGQYRVLHILRDNVLLQAVSDDAAEITLPLATQ